jgi:hypothetical protein
MSSSTIHFAENDRKSLFLWMNKILLFIYTTFSLFIHPSMDIFVGSISWLLWVGPQCTWEFRSVFDNLMLCPLTIYPEAGQLDHMVDLFLVFCGTSIFFSTLAILIVFESLCVSFPIWYPQIPCQGQAFII